MSILRIKKSCVTFKKATWHNTIKYKQYFFFHTFPVTFLTQETSLIQMRGQYTNYVTEWAIQWNNNTHPTKDTGKIHNRVCIKWYAIYRHSFVIDICTLIIPVWGMRVNPSSLFYFQVRVWIFNFDLQICKNWKLFLYVHIVKCKGILKTSYVFVCYWSHRKTLESWNAPSTFTNFETR